MKHGNGYNRVTRELDRILNKPVKATVGWRRSATDWRVEVPGRANYLYITLNGSHTHEYALNRAGVPKAINWPVLVALERNTWVIVATDYSDPSAFVGVPGNEFGVSPHPLSAHTDVDLDGVATGQVLTYQGGVWVNANVPAPPPIPNELTDLIDTPSDYSGAAGYVFKVNATEDGVVFEPGGGTYADEDAQDAVGGILTDSDTIDFTYDDGAPSITAIVKDTSITTGKIANDAVTNAKLSNMAQSTVKGRASGAGTGDPTDLSASQVRTILNVADGANNYVHPNHSGDVTSVGDGATTIASNAVTTAKIADGNVTNAKLANMAANTMKGNFTGSSAAPTDTSVATVLAQYIHGATEKTTPADADTLPLIDSAASNVLKKITWANIKAALTTLFDGLYVGLTGNQAVAGIKRFTDNMTIGLDQAPATTLDVRGSGAKGTTAAVEYPLRVASTDSSNPLMLQAGFKRDSTAGSRYGVIEVDDGGTKRHLILQPSGGNVGVGLTNPDDFLYVRYNQSTIGGITVENTNGGTTGLAGVRFLTDGGVNQRSGFFKNSSNSTNYGGAHAMVFWQLANNPISLVVNNSITPQMMVENTQVMVNTALRVQPGTASDDARVGGVMYTAVTDVGNVGGGEDDLHTYSIPANTLSTNGMSIWFKGVVTTAANGNAKTVKVYFGSAAILTLPTLFLNNGVWTIEGRIFRTGATTQRIMVSAFLDGDASIWQKYVTASQTLSNALTLKVTGESGSSATNDVVQRLFIVGWDAQNS